MSRDSDNEKLRRRLIAWDPARLEPLDPAATIRMRLRIAARLREPATARRRTTGWLIAAAAVATLLSLVLGWRAVVLTAPPPSLASSPPGARAAVATEVGSPVDEEPEEVLAPAVPAQSPATVAVAAPVVPNLAGTAPTRTDIVVAEERGSPRQPRQLQFQASGGTRIFWTLDPEFSEESLGAAGD